MVSLTGGGLTPEGMVRSGEGESKRGPIGDSHRCDGTDVGPISVPSLEYTSFQKWAYASNASRRLSSLSTIHNRGLAILI